MADQPGNCRNAIELVPEEIWQLPEKGLTKRLLKFEYAAMDKANDLSKCLIEIQEVKNWNPDKHKSNYLQRLKEEFWVEIENAVTPIDCYLDIFLKEMLTNETSWCSIATKSGESVEVLIELKKIEISCCYHEKKAEEMYKIAQKYKENGVKMFKDNYPLFAHQYFNKAAKCLLSFSPFTDLDELLIGSGILKKYYEDLLQNIYLNISACLIKQGRFDEILHVLKYVDTQKQPSEKAIYRLSTAYFHLKRFDDARKTIQRIDYKSNKELLQLHAKVQEKSKVEDTKYSDMVKKMFA